MGLKPLLDTLVEVYQFFKQSYIPEQSLRSLTVVLYLIGWGVV